MNKVFANSLNLVVTVYLDQIQHGVSADEVVLHQCKSILNEATEYGLVRWVDGLPLVNRAKMVGSQ